MSPATGIYSRHITALASVLSKPSRREDLIAKLVLPWLAYVKIPQLLFDHPTDNQTNIMGSKQSTKAKDVMGDVIGKDNLAGATVDESAMFLMCLLLVCCRPTFKRLKAIWRSGSSRPATAAVAYTASSGQIHMAAVDIEPTPDPAPVYMHRQPTIKRLAPIAPVHQTSVLPSAPPRYLVE